MNRIYGVLVLFLISFSFSTTILNQHNHPIDITDITSLNYNTLKIKHRYAKSRVSYYANSHSTFQLILSGDIQTNPGPIPTPKCPECNKPTRCNQKSVICEKCYNVYHASCLNMTHLVLPSQQIKFTCQHCLHTILPFHQQLESFNLLDSTETSFNEEDTHLKVINGNKNLLKVLHINTRSVCSSFEELVLTKETYQFDIIAMSETWLKDNQNLLDHVQIPNYDLYYNNRDNSKGGGVGCYVRSTLHTKRRKDIERIDPNLEHLWFQIDGRNKNSKLLVCVIYRSNKFFTCKDWLEKFEDLISKVKSISTLPLYITGDLNINMLATADSNTTRFQTLLSQFNLHQLVKSPTRQTATSSTLHRSHHC